MIKKALEYIVGLNKPELMEIETETYSDKPLHRISYNPKAEAIHLATLTSLMDYISSDTDVMADKMILYVAGPTMVDLCSQLDEERERELIATVTAELPDFTFGCFLPHEEFCIALQSKFIDNEDRKLLLKFAGTVESGSVAQYSDDGVSQKATVKSGVASKADAIVPGVVSLQPYRTFLNLDQPESQFIFRMRDGGRGVECAIFEADGGAWKDTARAAIHNYLEDAIAEVGKQGQFIVIS